MASLYLVLHCGQNGMVFSPCEQTRLETAPAKGLGFCNAPRQGAFTLRGSRRYVSDIMVTHTRKFVKGKMKWLSVKSPYEKVAPIQVELK